MAEFRIVRVKELYISNNTHSKAFAWDTAAALRKVKSACDPYIISIKEITFISMAHSSSLTVGSFGHLVTLLTECPGSNPGDYNGGLFPAISLRFQKKKVVYLSNDVFNSIWNIIVNELFRYVFCPLFYTIYLESMGHFSK